ncbi:MAG: hypothetical protein HYR84_08955, partial [Planctomycetes bacterium]|nr:hypothetical protein [Planctomycetota bacterium]
MQRILVVSLMIGVVSCSSGSRVRMEPIQGRVIYKDQPLERALVAFHPLGEYPPGQPKPIAYTDAAGRFRMTTNQPGEGVPLGEYAVTV